MKKQPLLIWVGALGLLSAALAGCTPSTPASSSENTTTSSVASSSSGQSSSSSSSTSSSSSSIPDSSSSSIEVVEFDISFDLNGHGGDVAPTTQKTEEGKIVAPEKPTDDDYNFLGWTLPDSEDVLDLSTYVFTASVTLKAKWEKRALNVSLKANYAIGDTITLYNDRVASAAIYKQGTDTALAAENGVVTLNEEGVFDYRITRTNGEIETYSFSVEETTRLVHTFATAEEDANSFDFHITYGENGGTTWLHDFNGEYGVRTSVKQFSDFQFEVGNTPFAFDTIIARVYFETSEVTQVKIGSFWSVIADSLPTNQWVDLAINRKAIQTGGSGMYKLYGANQAGITDDSVFYNDVFGGIGYNNQQAFRFNILNTETGAELSAKVYLSSVRYMPADETPNLVHGFATASDESDAFDRHIAYGDGGTDWLESYKGEYGVRKTKKGYNEMQFELGATAFHFDAVKIRAYFEIDGVEKLNLVSHYSHFADGIATNQWVDVTIARTAVQTGGSAMYAEFGANQAGLTDDSVFYSDVFGTIGNANQQAFRAVIYDTAGKIVTPIVYLANVSYVPSDDTSNLVHGFTTAEEDANSFDFHLSYGDGGTDWLESYKGEYGVRKTKKGYNEMQFSLGSEEFHFDAVKVRAYFEIDGVEKLNLVSHYSHFADGVATNQWVDVTIARTAVQTSGSAMYAEFGANQAGLTDDSVFYSDVFGAIGNANQQAFRAVFYDAASNNIVTPIVYLDNVSYVPAAA